MCRRGFTSFVAAAYFPTGAVSFSSIKKKFEGDLGGVDVNNASGFVFFVNQALSVGERKTLRAMAESTANPTELYHLERLRSVLDSPVGCGLRLEYLGIAMTHEEQLAYWSTANVDISAKLNRIEELQVRTLHQVRASEDDILRRTSAMLHDLRDIPSSLLDRPILNGAELRGGPATSDLDVPVLLWLHRVLLGGSGLPPALLGELRAMSVSVAPADGSAPYSPPPPQEVRDLLTEWCAKWRDGYSALQAQETDARLAGICSAYYQFLRIHPFLDGNGRMARALLDQMLRELLAIPLPPSFNDSRIEHQEALRRADAGDLDPLIELIRLTLL